MGLFSKKSKKAQHKIFQKENLIYLKISGQTSYDDFVSGVRSALKDEKYQKEYNWLVNVKGSKATFKPGLMEPLVQFVEKNRDKFGEVRIALLIANNKHYVSAQAMSDYFEEHDFKAKFRVFSLLPAAKKWLAE